MIESNQNTNDSQIYQRYGKEGLARSPLAKTDLKRQEFQWIVNHPDWNCLAITVVFKNLVPLGLHNGMKFAAENEYEKKVLTKIKKRLCRLQKYWDEVLPITDFFVYEYDQTSIFKAVQNAQTPHHIHGILPIPKHLVGRIIDLESGVLDERLEKDLRSLAKVSTFLIELLRLETADAWFHYLLKGKTQADFH